MLDTSYRGGSGPGGRQPAPHLGPSTSQRSSSWLQSGSQTFPTRAAELAVSTESSSSTATSKTGSREASQGNRNANAAAAAGAHSVSSVHPLPARVMTMMAASPATTTTTITSTPLLPGSVAVATPSERPHSILRRSRRQPSNSEEEDESEGQSTRRSERRIRFADPVQNMSSSSSSSSSSHSTPLVMPSSPHTPPPPRQSSPATQRQPSAKSGGSGSSSGSSTTTTNTNTTELEEEPALWRAGGGGGGGLPARQKPSQGAAMRMLSLPKEELSASEEEEEEEDELHNSNHTATPPRGCDAHESVVAEADKGSNRSNDDAVHHGAALDDFVHPSDSSDFSPHNHSASSQVMATATTTAMNKGRGVVDVTLSALSASSAGAAAAVPPAPHAASHAQPSSSHHYYHDHHYAYHTHNTMEDAAPHMTSAISDRSTLPSEPGADHATLPQLPSSGSTTTGGSNSRRTSTESERHAVDVVRDDIDERDVSEGVDPTDLHLSDDDDEDEEGDENNKSSDGEASDMKVNEAHTPPPLVKRQGLPERSSTRASSRVLTSPPSHSSSSSSSAKQQVHAKQKREEEEGAAGEPHKVMRNKVVVVVRKEDGHAGSAAADPTVQMSLLPIEQAAVMLGRSAESLHELIDEVDHKEEEREDDERAAFRRALRAASASRSPSHHRHHRHNNNNSSSGSNSHSPAVSHLMDHDNYSSGTQEGGNGDETSVRNALFDRSPEQLLTVHMNLFPKMPSVAGSAGRVPSSYLSYAVAHNTNSGSRLSSTEAAALDAAPSGLVQRLLQASEHKAAGTPGKEEASMKEKKSSSEGDVNVDGVPVWMARPVVMRAAVPLVSHPLQATPSRAASSASIPSPHTHAGRNEEQKNNRRTKKGSQSETRAAQASASSRLMRASRSHTPATPPGQQMLASRGTLQKDKEEQEEEDGEQVAEYVLLSPRPDKPLHNNTGTNTKRNAKDETASKIQRQIAAETASMQAARRALYSPAAGQYVPPVLPSRATHTAKANNNNNNNDAGDEEMKRRRRYTTTPSPHARQSAGGIRRGSATLRARSPAVRDYTSGRLHDSPIVAHDYYYSAPSSRNGSPRWSRSAQRARDEVEYLMKSAKAGAASAMEGESTSRYSHALSALDSAKAYYGKGKTRDKKKHKDKKKEKEKKDSVHERDSVSATRRRETKERSRHHSHSASESRRRHASSASRSQRHRHLRGDTKEETEEEKRKRKRKREAQRYLLVEPVTESTTRSRAASPASGSLSHSTSALSREQRHHRHRHHSHAHPSREHNNNKNTRRHSSRTNSTSSSIRSRRRRDVRDGSRHSSSSSSRRGGAGHAHNAISSRTVSERARYNAIAFGSAPLPRHSVTSVPLLVRDVTHEEEEKNRRKEDKDSLQHHHHHLYHHRDKRDNSESRSHRTEEEEEEESKSGKSHTDRHRHASRRTSSEQLSKLDKMIADWKREARETSKARAKTYAAGNGGDRTEKAEKQGKSRSKHEGRSKDSASRKHKQQHHNHHHHHSHKDKGKGSSSAKDDQRKKKDYGSSTLRRTASSPGRLTGSASRRAARAEGHGQGARADDARAERRRAIRAALQAIRSRGHDDKEGDGEEQWPPGFLAGMKAYYTTLSAATTNSDNTCGVRRASLASSSGASSLNVATSLLIQRYAALWQRRQQKEQQTAALGAAASPQADNYDAAEEYNEDENEESNRTAEVNVAGQTRSHGPRLSPQPEILQPGLFAQGSLDALVDTPRSGSLNEDHHVHRHLYASSTAAAAGGQTNKNKATYLKPSPEVVSVQLDEYEYGDEDDNYMRDARAESPQHIQTSSASSMASSHVQDTVGVQGGLSQVNHSNRKSSGDAGGAEERVVVDPRALLTFARGVCRIVHALEDYGEA